MSFLTANLTRQERYLIRQARMVAPEIDTTGLLANVRNMTCKIRISYICKSQGGSPILDPYDDELLPVAACSKCKRYIQRALSIDPDSADAHCRIKMGRADTYDALRKRGDLVIADGFRL